MVNLDLNLSDEVKRLLALSTLDPDTLSKQGDLMDLESEG